jgi:hypothetical protein
MAINSTPTDVKSTNMLTDAALVNPGRVLDDQPVMAPVSLNQVCSSGESTTPPTIKLEFRESMPPPCQVSML